MQAIGLVPARNNLTVRKNDSRNDLLESFTKMIHENDPRSDSQESSTKNPPAAADINIIVISCRLLGDFIFAKPSL